MTIPKLIEYLQELHKERGAENTRCTFFETSNDGKVNGISVGSGVTIYISRLLPETSNNSNNKL